MYLFMGLKVKSTEKVPLYILFIYFSVSAHKHDSYYMAHLFVFVIVSSVFHHVDVGAVKPH